MIPLITVVSKRAAVEILTDLEARRGYRYLISIGDPEEDLPKGYDRFHSPKLRLQFDDVSRACTPWSDFQMASISDIEQLIDFCATIDGPALIHCFAGISRSSAAACILAAIKMGPGREEEALQHVAELQRHGRDLGETVWPNKHMLNLADQLLGRDGKLLSAAFARWPQGAETVDLITIPTIPSRKIAKAR